MVRAAAGVTAELAVVVRLHKDMLVVQAQHLWVYIIQQVVGVAQAPLE